MFGGVGEKGEQKYKDLLFPVPVFQSRLSDESATAIDYLTILCSIQSDSQTVQL